MKEKISVVLVFCSVLVRAVNTEDHAVLKSSTDVDVFVEGEPRYIIEHAKSENYLATVILVLPRKGKRVPVDVHDGETADLIAASLFRHYSLPFGPQYIPVHNAIAAVLKRETHPADLSRSKVVPTGEPPHPFLAKADEEKKSLLKTTLDLAGGTVLKDVEVLEGEHPDAALQRWEQNNTMILLSSSQREEASELLTGIVADILISEDTILRKRRGPNATMAALFPSSTHHVLFPAKPLSVAPSPGWEDEDEDATRDAEEAQKVLFELQSPRSCHDRRVVVMSMDGAIWGLAVNVHYMTLLLSYCMVHNRTLVTASPDHWNYAGGWCTSGWECFFEPVSSCSESQVWEPYTTDIRDDIQFDYRQYLYQVDTSSERALYFSNTDGPWLQLLNREECSKFVPDRFRHRGLLWWRSQLTRFVFRPKRFVIDYVEERRQSMPWHAGIVGLHVRHGDKSWDVAHQGSYIGGLGPYLAKAEALCSRIASETNRRGPKHVTCSDPPSARYFISTDDASVLEEARQRRLRAAWDETEARFNGTHVYSPMGVSEKRWPGFPGNDPAVNTLRYTLDSIKSIVLLAEARLFVGTVTSCFSRLVYQLRVASRRSDPHTGDAWTVDHDPRHGPGWFVDP